VCQEKYRAVQDFLCPTRYNPRMGQRTAEFRHGDIRLLGFSAAGEETYVVAPELNLAFDVGRGQREVLGVDHVFLTHGHMDHAAGIAYYFSQRMFIDNLPGHLYAPEQLLRPIQRLLRVWGEIDGNEPPANIHPAFPGQDIELRRDLVVRPFQVNHPCHRRGHVAFGALGYAAIEVRRKLKDEYQGLAGPQIVELKKRGVEITRRLEIPLVAYCGDTAAGDFLDLDFVAGAKVLLLDCTFVDPDHQERARAGYHLHVSDLRDVLPRLRNERIVLMHLSRRTALAEAKEFLERELGPTLDERLCFFMDFRRRSGRRSPRENELAR
jgi:ribonuclease Z